MQRNCVNEERNFMKKKLTSEQFRTVQYALVFCKTGQLVFLILSKKRIIVLQYLRTVTEHTLCKTKNDQVDLKCYPLEKCSEPKKGKISLKKLKSHG